MKSIKNIYEFRFKDYDVYIEYIGSPEGEQLKFNILILKEFFLNFYYE
jgi:hypothetical protein